MSILLEKVLRLFCPLSYISTSFRSYASAMYKSVAIPCLVLLVTLHSLQQSYGFKIGPLKTMSWHRHPVLTSPPSSSSVTLPTVHHTYKPLYGKKEEEELIRATRGQRTAGAGERVVGEMLSRGAKATSRNALIPS